MILSGDSSFLLLLFICHFGLIGGASWSYDEKSPDGPSKWANVFENCKKDRQSPIDIVVDRCESFSPPKFDFSKEYSDDADVGHKLINNGHTIQLNVGSRNMTVTGGGLDSTYRLVQLHMHWGSTDKTGSEHLLDGKSYPLEIHLVHHNTAFPSLESSLNQQNGLAVLGIFAEVGPTEHSPLQTIIKNLPSVRHSGNQIDFKEKIRILDFLPKDQDSFFRYHGSLTTPPCYESVTWTVFQKPITVSTNQLKELRKVFHSKVGEQEAPLVDNYRPIQSLHARKVKRATAVPPRSNSVKTLQASFVSLSLPIMPFMFGLLRW